MGFTLVAAAVLDCSLPLNCSLRSRDARRNPAPSSPPVKRDPPRRHMQQRTLHARLLQSPEASIKSRGSRSKPPSSSHLVKRQLPRNSPDTLKPFHHLLLQIGGARSERLNSSLPLNCSPRSRDARRNPTPSSPDASIKSRVSDSDRVRFSARARRRTFGSPDNGAFAVTRAKTFPNGLGS
jgi:hypothetical protein